MKYRNRKVKVDGILFDSKKEAQRYQELKLLESVGEICLLKCQDKFVLLPEQREECNEVYKKGKHKGELKKGKLIERECVYIADFTYFDVASGEIVVEDVKGVKTREYVLKRKLMLFIHGIRIREI